MARGYQYSLGEGDLFRIQGNLLIRGTRKDDTLKGKGGDDTISGDKGDDKLYGKAGLDSLYGEKDKDRIHGDAGSDYIDGGTGNDQLWGGADADRFVFKTKYDKDTILDFETGDLFTHDTILLSGLKSVADYEDLVENHMRQAGRNVVIDGEHGDVLVLKKVDIEDLESYHFSF